MLWKHLIYSTLDYNYFNSGFFCWPGIHVGRQLHLDKIHFKWPPLHRSFVVVRIGVSFVLVLVPCGAGTGSKVLLVVASPCRQTGVSGSWGGSSAATIPPSSHCADHWVPTPSTAADCHSCRGVEKCHSRCLGVMLFRCSPSASYFGRPPHTWAWSSLQQPTPCSDLTVSFLFWCSLSFI